MLWLWEMEPDRDKLERENFCETSAYKLKKRFAKTLYCGEVDEDDITDDEYEDDEDTCPSLPLTDIAVEYFQDVAPRKFGRIDRVLASSVASRACVTPCSVMMSMIYAKRLRHKNSDYLDQISSSDLFLISMMMASKFIYDEGVEEEVFNDEWADAADIDLDEINTLERQFLKAIDWQLFIKRDEFFQTVNQIEQRIALQQALDRGWFTYTDLHVLMRNPQFNSLWSNIGSCWLQVMCISSTAYLASVLTMIGSTIAALQVSTALTLAGSAMLATHGVPQGPVFMPFDTNVKSEFTPLSEMNQSFGEEPTTQFTSETENFSSSFGDGSLSQGPATRPTDSETHATPKLTLTSDSLLETLIQKLFTLVTIKGHLVKFVCAVSENYHNSLHGLSSGHKLQSNRVNKSVPTSYQPCSSFETNERLTAPNICPDCQAKKSHPRSRSHDMQGPRYLSVKRLPIGQPVVSSHGLPIRQNDRGHPCCCEEPPGFVLRLVDTSLRFSTRSSLPLSVGA